MSFAQPFRDYEILDRVGAGAMGTVFKARQHKLGRIVALKVLRPSLARDTRYVERLRREARIVASLNHPNIVTGYDLGEEGGYHYFVMEFVEGRSLRALLSEWGIFAEEQVRSVGKQIAAALDHAFSKDVIHRDIKPGNILIDDAGTVKVTDMGLAKGPADLSLTRDGSTVGTPQYISPEQARNPQDVDIRSDLYSLGSTLYHMATGQPPFQGTSVAEVITQVLNETPISPRVINPDLSEGMSLVIRKLLSKSPKLRYQTPRELLDDLERLERDQRPQVDESRLTAGEAGHSPRAMRWFGVVIAAAALAGGGFWLGASGAAAPLGQASDGDFIARVDAELAALDTPGQRWQHFFLRAKEAPDGATEWIQRRQRELAAAIQTAIDAFAAEVRSRGLEAIQQEAEDPQRWPPGAAVARAHVLGPLARALGLPREQVPASADTRGLDTLLTEIEEIVRRRDQALAETARRHLDVEAPMRAEERLRQGDYAGAERLWRESFLGFFDGLRHPSPDKLAASLRAQMETRYEQSRTQGLAQIDAAEQRAAAALRMECAEGLAAIRAQGLAKEPSARAYAERLASVSRLREQLAAAYPSAARFRAANDPWHEVGAQIAACERELQDAFTESERLQEEQLADLAWRAFLDGDAEAGLGVLQGCRAREASEPDWIEPHRQAMRAAGAVARAVTIAIASAPPPVPGYPRNGGVPVELRADPNGTLQARIGAGAWRAAQLFEFRFGDLWRRGQENSVEAFAALGPREVKLGRTVLAMACDQLDELPDGLEEPDRSFLRDQVWPRLLRVRSAAAGFGDDRAAALRRVREALERGRERSEPRDVEAALAQWEVTFGANASEAERSIVKEARDWSAQESLRQRRLAEIQRLAPDGSEVEVSMRDGLRASVRIPPTSMRSAGEGWQLRNGRMEHVGNPASWAEAFRRKLEVDPGLGAACKDAALECEFALPAGSQQQGMQVFEFQGAACVVFVTGDGLLRAGIVADLAKGTEALQIAVQRAVHAAMDRKGPAPTAIPLALHTLRFSIQSTPGRRASTLVVAVDGVELCRSFVDGAASAPAKLAIYPLQDLSLRNVRIDASE